MATTFEQAEAALRDYQSTYGRVQDEKWALIEEMRAVDLESPTAVSQLNSILDRHDSSTERWNNSKDSSLALLNSVVDSLPPDGFFSNDKSKFMAKVASARVELHKLTATGNAALDDIVAKLKELEKESATKSVNGETVGVDGKGTSSSVNDDSNTGSQGVEQTDQEGKNGVLKWPGARPFNPLSQMSSYTYGISLYVTTSEVANKFVQSGGTMEGIDPKVDPIYVVAQSGGANSNVENKISPNGFDYYIDDLTISSVMPNSEGMSPTATTEIKFKIYEPIGFSFLKDLSAAAHKINQQSEMVKSLDPKFEPPLQNQAYILGIRFAGYGPDGTPVKASDSLYSDYTGGYVSENSVIERYYSIVIASMRFSLDGKMVSYNVIAKPISENEAYGEMNATLKKSETLSGSTIYDILMGGTGSDKTKNRGLAKALNDMYAGYKDQKVLNTPNVYKFQFLDENGQDVGRDSPIAKATVFSPTTATNVSKPNAGVSNTSKVTVKETLSSVAIDKAKSLVTVNQGQSIVSVIDNLITKSTYVSDCLNKIANESVTTTAIANPVTKQISWFSINPVIKRLARDTQLNNWAYEITYQIKPFKVPYVISQYVDEPIKFPGTFKEYEYWLTGKNSEVISYNQEYKYIYYQPVPVTGGSDVVPNNGRGTHVPRAPQGSPGATDTRQGGQNKGSQFNESVRVSLYSPADIAITTIKILGDPDFLMSGLGVNNTGFPQYYGKGFSINPNSGQVFIRINFRSADDYGSDGNLNILGPIRFYEADTGNNISQEGLIYMVINVESTFSKGAFTQVLKCVIVPEEDLVVEKTNKETSVGAGQKSPRIDKSVDNAESRRLSQYRPSSAAPLPKLDLRVPVLNDTKLFTDTNQTSALSPVMSAPVLSSDKNPQQINRFKQSLMSNVNKDDQTKTSQQSPISSNDDLRPTRR